MAKDTQVMAPSEEEILRVLAAHPEPMTPARICELAGVELSFDALAYVSRVRRRLKRLAMYGKVRQVGDNWILATRAGEN